MHNHVRPYAIEFVRARHAQLDDESFGERLSRLRQRAGLNTAELARRATTGTHKIYRDEILRWESGQKRPAPSSRTDVINIATALGVDPQFLLQKFPKEPYFSQSFDTGLPVHYQRHVAKHLPDNFNRLSDAKKEEIFCWVAENIISTPKEILEDGTVSQARPHDLSIYCLGRDPRSRRPLAPRHLLDEIDRVAKFKTNDFTEGQKKRNQRWKKISKENADYQIRAFFGALYAQGFPLEAASLSAILVTDVIDSVIDWRKRRRGGHTYTIIRVLQIFDSLLHPRFGFIAQTPDFGERLRVVPGFITQADVDRAHDWAEACRVARAHIHTRISDLKPLLQQGRDPFEAIRPVLNDDNPRDVYHEIAREIRARMPDRSSGVRRPEALRALMLLRLGLVMPLRQKNMRQLLICPPGKRPRSFKRLARLRRGEMVYDPTLGWRIRITREAFKNENAKALRAKMELPIPDIDGLYDEIAEYLQAREILLNGAPDPGTFFVKTMQSRAENPEYTAAGYYNAYRAMITKYGIYNPYTGRGAIRDLKPHGPHSVRHIMATYAVKKTYSYAAAASLLLDTEETIREAYAEFGPENWFGWAQHLIWGDLV
jgi:transcriptional regulator with XRE-family HTH domain